MDPFARRQEQLARFVAAEGLDGFLVTSPVNVSYLTNFSGDSSYLLVGRQRSLLVTDGRYEEQLGEECPNLPLHVRPPSVKVGQATLTVLEQLGWRAVGIEAERMAVAELQRFRDGLPTVNFKPCGDVIERQRAIKDVTEIAAIREAIGMAERAFTRWVASLRPTDTERQLGHRIEMLVRMEGAERTAFAPIVGVGPRAALPHAPLSDTPLGEGELVLLDWGANGRFYKSDLTRVVAGPKISPKLEQVHDVVLRTQQAAIAALRPGVQAQQVDATARAVLQEAGFLEFFNHGLGHGFGLEIHETPFMRPTNETVLEAGMVVTVEPGVYLPGWGGVRIEDDVLITPDGCEVLTSLPRGVGDFRY
jgi:Xaa-Pro aminopeptidase